MKAIYLILDKNCLIYNQCATNIFVWSVFLIHIKYILFPCRRTIIARFVIAFWMLFPLPLSALIFCINNILYIFYGLHESCNIFVKYRQYSFIFRLNFNTAYKILSRSSHMHCLPVEWHHNTKAKATLHVQRLWCSCLVVCCF